MKKLLLTLAAMLVCGTLAAGVKIIIDGVELPSTSTIKITQGGVEQPVPDDSVVEISTRPPAPSIYIDITPDTLPTTTFESGKAYRLTRGVYQGVTLEGVDDVYLTATPDALIAGNSGKFDHALTVFKCRNATIENISATGGAAGIALYYSPNALVRKCRLYQNTYWGVFGSFSHRTTVEDCRCEDNLGQHGIYMSNSSDQHVIRNNTCVGHSRTGVQINGDKYSTQSNFPDYFAQEQVDGISTGNLIEGNNLVGNSIGINLDGVQGSTVRGNTIENSVRLYQIDGNAPSNGNSVEGNTIAVRQESHGVMLRDFALGNVIQKNVIRIDTTEAWRDWSFPISYTTGCELNESGNVLIAPGAIGGGSNGKTAEITANSTHVKN